MAKSASEFVQRLQEDEQFARTVKERVSADPSTRHDIVSEMGYEFTDSEFETALKAAGADASEGELSEDALEGVAGGTTFYTTSTYRLSTSFETPIAGYSFPSTSTMEHAGYW